MKSFSDQLIEPSKVCSSLVGHRKVHGIIRHVYQTFPTRFAGERSSNKRRKLEPKSDKRATKIPQNVETVVLSDIVEVWDGIVSI